MSRLQEVLVLPLNHPFPVAPVHPAYVLYYNYVRLDFRIRNIIIVSAYEVNIRTPFYYRTGNNGSSLTYSLD